MDNLSKRKNELQNKIRTLEWDLKRNQIHFAKKIKLNEFKKELEEIKEKLKSDNNE